MGWCSMEKLAGDLLLELKFVRLEIISTSFIDFLYEDLEELRSRYLGPKGLNFKYFLISFLNLCHRCDIIKCRQILLLVKGNTET